MSGRGRGGKRIPGDGKKIGPPIKAPGERAIRKSYRLPPDVVGILAKTRNATEFICKAVREFANKKDPAAPP